jgi:uncharacterized membrane protein
VHEAEQGTSAEIRISIRDSRETSEAGLEMKDLAMKEFLHLGMEKTTERSGILLFILYDERKFYVMGDEGVHKRTSPEGWKDVAATLGSHFKEAHFEAGVIAAMKKIQHHVRKEMPSSGLHTQELSEEVVIS